jgi:chromosome segregation ATPase
MPAELNELLEEASGQCSALSDDLDDTVQAVKSIVTRAEDVWEAASKGGEDTRRRLSDLVSRLDDAESALEDARGDAAGALDDLSSKAEGLKGRVGELLEKVHEGLRELQEHEQQIGDDIDSRMQAAGADYEALAQRIQDVKQAIDDDLQQAAQAIADFRDAVGQARADLQQKQQEWAKAVDDLEEDATEQTEAWVTGIQDLLTDQTRAMIDAANKMIERHNQTMDLLKQRFAEEAADEVATAITPLQEKLEALVELAETKKGELSARSSDALQRVQAALPVLEQLKAAFESTGRLG